MSDTYQKIIEDFTSFKGPISNDHIILSDHIPSFNIPRDGYWLEFGVYSGKTINKLSKCCNLIYGFDSFDGLPEDWTDDIGKGHFSVPEPPRVEDNVELVIGWFDETLPKFVKEYVIDKISFINIDCDLYSSTKTIFKHLGPYIKPGTYIYFDEFLIKKNMKENEAKAFAEFLDEYNYGYRILMNSTDHLPIQTIVEIV